MRCLTLSKKPAKSIEMKKVVILFFFITLYLPQVFSQEMAKPSIYDPAADAWADIQKAVQAAKDHDKNVLLMIGGNWCPWCIRLHKLLTLDTALNSLLNDNFVWVMVNYSKENRNLDLLAELGHPQRFGFPVWVILDGEGKVIHIQDTSLFEMDEDYIPVRVRRTLQFWTTAAVNPD